MELTVSEYKQLLPFKEKILRFKQSNNYSGGEMFLFDRIKRGKGGKPTFFDCDGCKHELLTDIYNLFVEYELAHREAKAV